MQGSGIGGSSQGRKSADLIKVATRERQRGGSRSGVPCERVGLFTAGHHHQVSRTSWSCYSAHAICETRMGTR